MTICLIYLHSQLIHTHTLAYMLTNIMLRYSLVNREVHNKA